MKFLSQKCSLMIILRIFEPQKFGAIQYRILSTDMHREGLGMANLLVGMTENDITVNSHCNNSKQQHLGLSAMDPVLTLQFIHLLKIGSTQILFFLTCTSL